MGHHPDEFSGYGICVDCCPTCGRPKSGELQRVIRELAAVAELGFYGTTENHNRKVTIVNDPVVKGIVGEK